MHRPSDEHIMNDIREKLNSYRPAYQPESWQQMSGKLDQQAFATPKFNFTSWLLGVASGLILTTLIIGIILFNQQHKTTLLNTTYIEQIDSLKHIIEQNKKNNTLHSSYTSDFDISNTNHLSGENNQDKNLLPPIPIVDISLSKSWPISNHTNYLKDENMTQVMDFEKLHPNHCSLNDSINTIYPRNQIELIHPTQISNKEKLKRKRTPFNWEIFNLKIKDEPLSKFTGPNLLKLYYSPELIFSDFQDAPGISHGIGISTEGALTRRLSMGIGTEFRTYKWKKNIEYGSEKWKYSSIIIAEATDTTPAILKNDSAWVYQVDSLRTNTGSWQYFEIPVELRYQLMETRHSSLYLSGSISALLFYKEDYDSALSKDGKKTNNSESSNPFKNYHIPARFKFGLEYRYKLKNRFSLSIEPYYRGSWNGLGTHQLKPGAFGLNTGIIYRFGKERQ